MLFPFAAALISLNRDQQFRRQSMSTSLPARYSIRRLTSDDISLMEGMMTMFGEVFEDLETYCGARPGAGYHQQLLDNDHFFALTALADGAVVGGLAAYELPKFEQARSEIYIYDLAVAAEHRREGIATALIQELRNIAAARGVYLIFVQADYGDDPAIALYTKLGKREDIMHFDIEVN
jgi:aminoglycoside 3-N-acetyltransferase I